MKIIWKTYLWLCGIVFSIYLVACVVDPNSEFVQQYSMFESFFISCMGAFVILACFLPSIIAYDKNHPSRNGIAIMNCMLGWTGLFWFISLIWANSGAKPVNSKPSLTDKLEEIEDLLRKKRITSTEYRVLREKVLKGADSLV